ncbi:hypothetical protein [Lysobacter sp.]|uniref:hypothetical protein n=1 Tax=Lysobacter sp. TaxID=72226 RepID=UPI002D41C0FA|nr:hypothetical protein [Lysobacter sp.]HZX76160.1 hypothetical protein [Lysobacter sp.]
MIREKAELIAAQLAAGVLANPSINLKVDLQFIQDRSDEIYRAILEKLLERDDNG